MAWGIFGKERTWTICEEFRHQQWRQHWLCHSSDLSPDDAEYFCNGDATFTIDGRTYDLAKDTDETAAALVIRSGSLLTAAIPDEDGYVEFFLETSRRQVHAHRLYHYTFHHGAGGGGSSLRSDYVYGVRRK